MLRYSIFFIFLLSCTQSFVENTQNMEKLNASASYGTTDEGILLNWEIKTDFVSVEILKGNSENDLKPYQSQVVQTELMDTDTLAGKDYYYRVNVFNFQGRQVGTTDVLKGKRSYREYNSVVAPYNLLATKGRYSDKISLVWSGDYQDRFRIYRSLNQTADFVLIDEVSFEETQEFYYWDTNVKPGTTYFYKVSSVGIDEGIEKEKYHNTTVQGTTSYSPTGLVASKNNSDYLSSIHLKWDRDTSVDFYKVYRSTKIDGVYDEIASLVLDIYYVDKELPNVVGKVIDGKFTYPTYYYKIKAVKKVVESDFSSIAEGSAINESDVTKAPNLAIVTNVESYPYSVKISWEPITGAESYQIVQYKDSTTNTIEITSLNTTFESGSLYSSFTYEVRGISVKEGGLKILGHKSMNNYRHVVPAPLNTVKVIGNRIDTTNIVATPKDVYVYEKKDGGNINERNVGTIEEWTITPEVGFIAIGWESPKISVDTYNVYKRRKGDSTWNWIVTNTTATNYKDTKFNDSELTGSGSGDSFKYPAYEYSVRPVLDGEEGGNTITLGEGFAINPKDILPAPSHVSIPAHWAKDTGFDFVLWGKGKRTWQTGANSPPDASLVQNLGRKHKNHLYLIWGEVADSTGYRVRHSKGESKDNWYENREFYPYKPSNKNRIQWYNNETTGEDKTGLYVSDDFGGYVPNSAAFDVASVNGNAGGVIGETRGILFKESKNNPF